MKAIIESPPAVTAGVSAAELEVMRESAARLTGTGSAAGTEDLFGELAAPFSPAPPGGRANYHRSGGHLWCHGVKEQP
jgi:hypothetical protein